MSDTEYEKFEVTEDDLQNEFNINRRRFQLSRNQQIYGVFAPDEDDDDDGGANERPSFGRQSKNYAAPINFVGGGVQKQRPKDGATGRQQPGGGDEEEMGDDDDEDDENYEYPDGGDIFSQPSSSTKLGWMPGGSASSSTSAEPKKVAPRSSGSLAGLKGPQSRDFGQWEKYTKGIGMKLLLQQGYKPGKGLGKDLQGISQPVEAKLRKGRGAIGAYGSERTEQQLKSAAATVDLDEEEAEDIEFRKKLGQWKKSEQEGSKKKVKYVYKTVDEVISEGSHEKFKGDTSQLSKVKVIDMTGPEQRILSGYHAIHNQHSKPSDAVDEAASKVYQNFALPELLHNLNLLIDMSEQQILQNDRELRLERDQIVNMTHEKDKLERLIDQERKQLDASETLLRAIDNLQERSRENCLNPLTLSEAAAIVQELQDEYFTEYKLYEVSELSAGVVLPLVKRFFANWDPTKDTTYGTFEMKEWKDILEVDTMNFNSDKIQPYDLLIWEAWVPRIRAAITMWNCRDPNNLIELVENWLPLLPPWITNNILEQIILPRLQRDVEDWNPLTDNVPIDAWIHPWLPLMGNRLEILYPTIRHKLANGLVNWNPNDCSAKLMLQPWRNVFSQGTMDAFLIKNVLPKLALCIQDFHINPHQQHLGPWQWFVDWEDMIPLASMIGVLENHFFPRWLQTLCAWLGHNPNYDEVTKWYTGWKSMMPENFSNHPYVKEQFNRALNVMDNAVSMPQQGAMGYQPGPQEHYNYLAGLERRREMDNIPAQVARDYEVLAQSVRSNNAPMPVSFKDLVERRAMEHGLVFMPIPNRYQEAKQVYRFGNTCIYMDRSVLFLHRDRAWVPTSLQSLIDVAK